MTYHQLVMEDYVIFTKLVFERLNDRELTSGQPKILEYLAKNDGAVQKDIATYCKIEPATVTNLLTRMEKNGLITRRVFEENRRYFHIFLTDKGKEKAEKLVKIFDEAEKKALAGLTKDEIENLCRMLKHIGKNLSE